MLDGSFWRISLVTLILLLPGAIAASPSATLQGPVSLQGQDITDVALEPTGQFAMIVVAVDPAKIGGIGLPTQQTKNDLLPCDFGPVDRPSSGVGCPRALNHRAGYGDATLGTAQSVAATSFIPSGGIVARYAVGGPSDTVSYWTNIQETATWERKTENRQAVVNVSISPNASRIFATTMPANPSGGGELFVYDTAGAGSLAWSMPLNDAGGNTGAVRPTSLHHARNADVLAVGTTSGVLFLKASAARPQTTAATRPLDTSGAVTEVVLASHGRAAVAGTTTGVYYIPLENGVPAPLSWNRGLLEGASRVALSGDGERFAAASGSKVFFYRHLNDSRIGESFGEPCSSTLSGCFDLGAPVTDLVYDEKGTLLVALAGNKVFGFGPTRSAPIWVFDATASDKGALDGPLRKVSVSDDGRRIVVAGKTKVMSYVTRTSVSAAFEQQGQLPIVPQNPLTLPLKVTNTGSLPDNYTFVVRRPVGWNGENPGDLALLPDESGVVNLTVDAPLGTNPGIFSVSVEVRSKLLADHRKDNLLTTASLNLTVPRAVNLLVTTAEERFTIAAGEERTIPVTIRNQGNAEGLVNLSATQQLSGGSSWDVRFARDQVPISAGGEQTVNMLVLAPRTGASGERNLLTIHAKEGTLVDAIRNITLYVDPEFRAELTASNASLAFAAGELQTVRVTIHNRGNTDDTYNVTGLVSPPAYQNDWRFTIDTPSLTIERGASKTVTVTIRPGVAEPRDASLNIRAISQGSLAEEEGTISISLVAKPREVTPTEDGFDIPAPGATLVVSMVALAVLLARTRRGGLE